MRKSIEFRAEIQYKVYLFSGVYANPHVAGTLSFASKAPCYVSGPGSVPCTGVQGDVLDRVFGLFTAVVFLFTALLAGCGPLPGGEATVTAVTSVPSGLTITHTTSSSVILTWIPSTGAVFSYTIYRNGVEVGHTSNAGVDTLAPTTFTDTNLSPITTYYYSVSSATLLGEESDRSNPVAATTIAEGDAGPPVATVNQTTTSSITISWIPSGVVPYLVSYRIYRNGTQIAATTGTMYVDTNLSPGTTYTYTITTSTESPQSTQLLATTQQSAGGGGSTTTSLKAISTLAGTAGSRNGSVDGMGSAAAFGLPYGITRVGTDLYVTDSSSHTIRKIETSTGKVTTLAGRNNVRGSTDGAGAAASFNGPRGIATDGTNLYVADSSNNTIRKIVIATGEVSTLAGTAGARGATDAVRAQASFFTPRGIATDGSNVYVADSGNQVIRKIVLATGEVSTLAGKAGTRGKTDGIGAAAGFYLPYGIACYGGRLYVGDSCNHAIRAIDISTGLVSTLAGTAGKAGIYDGFGTAASFTYPDGLVVEGATLYVADTGNSTIRRIGLDSGEVVTIAGVAGSSGSLDSSGTYGTFFAPHGIMLLGSKLYVADTNNNTIRQVSLDML
ncbi:MAG TPA: hypothetical protein DCZ75_15335 [Geobacter sp.]|nr:hypothetical protein [Geobacter sp.]